MNAIKKELLVQDVAKYVYGLRHTNGWGQSIIDGLQSHAYRWQIGETHGHELVTRIIDSYFEQRSR